LKPAIKANVTSIPLRVKQSTTKVTVTVKVTKQLKNTVSQRGQADVAAWLPAPVFIYHGLYHGFA
jgi:hypothetical protein